MNTQKNLIEGMVILLLAASLYFSRDISELVLLFLIGYFFFTLYTIKNQSFFSFILLSVLTALTLALRIPYLPWGDPWQDYAMIIRTLTIGYPDFWVPHEPVLQSLIAQPLMPAFLAFLTYISSQDPMVVQKVVVPIVGATAPVLLFWFAKDVITEKSAFLGATLFLISTPFLHWLTQPVRETLAIPVLFIALWMGYECMFSQKISQLFLTVAAILILSPLHTLSSLIFLISWYGISLGYLFIQNQGDIRKKTIISWSIFVSSFLYSTIWVISFNSPYMNVIVSQIASILHVLPPAPGLIIITLLIVLSIPYLFFLLTARTKHFSSDIIQIPIKNIRTGIRLLQVCGVIALIGSLFFISGQSSFKISYPLPMLIPSMVIFLLALIGLPRILTRRSFHIISWLGILGFFFLIGVIRPSLVEDPLRTLGYLFAPLCLIAGIGVSDLSSRILPHPNLSRVGIIGISLFCTCSLIFTFPAPIFLGYTPHPDEILFDERQYTIAHSGDEIEGIKWLAAHHKDGTVYTDTNIYYATLWITQNGGIRAEKHPNRLDPAQFKNNETSYVLISDRMFTSAKFGGWLYEKPTPVSSEEYQKIISNGTLIYKKGELKIFQFPRITKEDLSTKITPV